VNAGSPEIGGFVASVYLTKAVGSNPMLLEWEIQTTAGNDLKAVLSDVTSSLSSDARNGLLRQCGEVIEGRVALQVRNTPSFQATYDGHRLYITPIKVLT
jgi:hypothetical protein